MKSFGAALKSHAGADEKQVINFRWPNPNPIPFSDL